jgi:hypothetical protein
MRRPTDRLVDAARKRGFGDLPRLFPQARHRGAGERAIAGEGELAAGPAFRALEDDAADAVRIGRVADPVQHHLSNGFLASERLDRGFIIDCGGEALDRALLVDLTLGCKHERARRGIWNVRDRNGGVDRHRIFRRDLAEAKRLRRGRRLGAHGSRKSGRHLCRRRSAGAAAKDADPGKDVEGEDQGQYDRREPLARLQRGKTQGRQRQSFRQHPRLRLANATL